MYPNSLGASHKNHPLTKNGLLSESQSYIACCGYDAPTDQMFKVKKYNGYRNITISEYFANCNPLYNLLQF